MPEQFPVVTDSGEVSQVPYYTIDEVAEMFHTSRETIYKRMRDGEWPYIRVIQRVYFSPAHIQEIIRKSTHDDGSPAGLYRERADKGKRRKRAGGAS
jgi:excisionase family DNA binding protein